MGHQPTFATGSQLADTPLGTLNTLNTLNTLYTLQAPD
jgi:hypothetical protein